jgi:hypothetical protein
LHQKSLANSLEDPYSQTNQAPTVSLTGRSYEGTTPENYYSKVEAQLNFQNPWRNLETDQQKMLLFPSRLMTAKELRLERHW